MNRSTATVGLVVALACGGESRSTSWKAEGRVAGDTTTVHTVAGQVWTSPVQLNEELSIGALDGPRQLMFGTITKLADDLRGGIYVLDGQGPEIRHFDASGRFIRAVGRAGEGPGEYTQLSLGMVVDSAGVLYLYDWGNLRVVRFAEDGRALDPWPIDSSFRAARRGTWIYSDGPGRLSVTTRVDDHPALLVVEGGQVLDTLEVPRLPGVPEKRGGPYRVETYWDWHPDGYFVVGVSNVYSLELHRSDGVLRIRRDVEERAVHPEEADAVRRQFEWMERHPRYRPPEGEWLPSTMPPFRGIEVGSDGRIWVRRNVSPIPTEAQENPDSPPQVGWRQPFVYDVFEPDGTFLGEIRFPERFEPHLFGAEHVWGVRRGDLDEEYVVRLSISVPE